MGAERSLGRRVGCLAIMALVSSEPARTTPDALARLGSIEGNYGYCVAGLGDVNGDGSGDFAVGWPCASPEQSTSMLSFASQRGLVRVHDGRTGQILQEIRGHSVHQMFGVAIAGLGDLDGDAAGDFAVGSVLGNDARVFSGRSGELLHRLIGSPDQRDELFGLSLAAVRDVDGDGMRDLLVGAPRRTTVAWIEGSPEAERGGAYLFSGCSGALLRSFGVRDSLDESSRGWWFGRRVAAAGDVDGDGVEDLAVASCGEVLLDLGGRGRGSERRLGIPSDVFQALPWLGPELTRPPEGGRVSIFSGRTGACIRQLVGEREGDGFGSALAAVGDLDGDGCGELAVGAFQSRDSGVVRLFDGASGRLLAEQGSASSCEFAYTLASVGDLDGDGQDDLAVGDPCLDGGPNRIGEVVFLSSCGLKRLGSLREGGPDLNVSDFGMAIAAVEPSTTGSRALAVGALNVGWYGMAFAYSLQQGTLTRTIHLDLDGLYGRPHK